ncbi:lytic transglycosylase domain-containing protein [Citrobacter freundii]|uniref:lytic transglycosylase domain-containing protein n=1 Tax=Citrobacter freundii complex TaxID=1344959 RepID=UPI000BD74836|nr:lytic transglycosylase domain-containing protein [Citrobacter freundii]PCQ45094.1 lytic transglycosylase [Citrobacter freundii]
MISTATFLALAIQCAPDVAPDTLARIVKTESGFNPWAIGVVGKSLKRQPQNKEEALAAVKQLVKEKANFSIGLGQINRQYFDADNAEAVFSPCTNLKMSSNLLKDCYVRALKSSADEQQALLKTFSCYYSGNYTRGFVKENNGTSYVDRVVAVNTTGIKVPALNDNGIPEQSPRQERPTYDSWDVLQQYPKYSAPTQGISEPSADTTQEEQTDVKS